VSGVDAAPRREDKERKELWTNQTRRMFLLLTMAALVTMTSGATVADRASDERVFAFYVTISPAWFHPAV
jgi:hypothetical protein